MGNGGGAMRALSVVLMVALAVALVGCSPVEYDLGYGVEVSGLTVVLHVQRWTVVGSGTVGRPETYRIDWGDGTTSTERDGRRIDTYWRWVHTYAAPGQYTIVVCGSGDRVEVVVNVP